MGVNTIHLAIINYTTDEQFKLMRNVKIYINKSKYSMKGIYITFFLVGGCMQDVIFSLYFQSDLIIL